MKAKKQVALALGPQEQRALFRKLVNTNFKSKKTYYLRYQESPPAVKPRFASETERQQHAEMIRRRMFLRLVEKNALEAGVPFSAEKVITQSPYDYLIFEKLLVYARHNRS